MNEAKISQSDQAWKKIIHFEIERDGNKYYLCNQAVNTFSYKRTTDKEKVTCRNCLGRIK